MRQVDPLRSFDPYEKQTLQTHHISGTAIHNRRSYCDYFVTQPRANIGGPYYHYICESTAEQNTNESNRYSETTSSKNINIQTDGSGE